MNKAQKGTHLVANYEVYANQRLLVSQLLDNSMITWDKPYSRSKRQQPKYRDIRVVTGLKQLVTYVEV